MHKKKHISCIIMMLLIVIFDQITKYIVTENISDGTVVPFIKGFVQFRYVENTGMAFSMLTGARIFFIILTILVCVGVLTHMFINNCKSLWSYWSLGVIVAGGVGNLIDRCMTGYVVDFIEPTFVNFAVFNIADSAVTLGAIVLIAYLVVDAFKKDSKKEPIRCKYNFESDIFFNDEVENMGEFFKCSVRTIEQDEEADDEETEAILEDEQEESGNEPLEEEIEQQEEENND